MTAHYRLRLATPGDLALVQTTIVRAMQWNPQRLLPPPEHLLARPELARYHVGWGRAGDIGVVAESNGEPIGMAFFRLFTDDDHGEGFVDSETPELVIGVAEHNRGDGVGGALLESLAERALANGITQISLSVDAANPALRLYERRGYVERLRDEHGVLMVKALRRVGVDSPLK